MKWNEIFEQQINELSPKQQDHIMSTNWDLPEDLIKWLKSKKLKLLGRGRYSQVYGKEGTDKVVKINHDLDPANKKFIEFCHQHPNKYLPKIYDYKELAGGLYLYIIEKLEPFNKNNFEITNENFDFLCWLEKNDGSAFIFLDLEDAVKNYVVDKFENERFAKNFKGHINSLLRYVVNLHADEFSKTSDGKLLKPIFSFGNADIHDKNVMIRPGTNQLVLSDPVQTY